MTLNAIEGKPLPIYGDGLNVRDRLYVEDHGGNLNRPWPVAESAKRITLVATAIRTNIDVVRTICQTVNDLLPELKHNCGDLITFVRDRPGHSSPLRH